jgi:hypothetical protein
MRSAIAAVVLGAALGLGACGGDDDATESATTSDGSAAADEAPVEAGASASAEITVGDQTYSFDMAGIEQPCSVTDTSVSGVFALDADGTPIPAGDPATALALSFVITPEDWETQNLQEPQIGVDDAAAGIRWQAGETGSTVIQPGQSQIDSWTRDGNAASGDATFVDLNAVLAGGDVEPVSGTFDISCGT